jgi:eukaryotic-like serine/threonine-protein kinase
LAVGQDRTSQRVGKYRLLGELGAGGTAIVYLAAFEAAFGFTKLAVLKMLRPELEQEPDLVSMFVEEARLAGRLNHPNVVQTNEVIEAENGRRFIVMEYLEGQPLNVVQHQQPPAGAPCKLLPRAVHLRILSEAIAGLAYAHDMTDFDGKPLMLVHRDMSPHNVFVAFDGQVKILDFGIATSTTRSRRTETGMVKGKFRYMAPEQFLGSEGIDRRADVFSVGIMIWEAIVGQSMWGRLTDAQVMSKLLSGAIPSLKEAAPDVTPLLDALCTKALAADPDDRHASCIELKKELDAAILDLVGSEAATATSSATATISDAMNALFQVERDERRRKVATQIQAAMNDDAAAPADADASTGSPAIPTPPPPDASHAAVSVNAQRSSLAVPDTRRIRPSAFLLNAAALAIVAFVGFGWWMWPAQAGLSTNAQSHRTAKLIGASFDRSSRPRLSRPPELDPAASETPAPLTPKSRSAVKPAEASPPSSAAVSPSASSSASTPAKKASTRDLDRENPWK